MAELCDKGFSLQGGQLLGVFFCFVLFFKARFITVKAK